MKLREVLGKYSKDEVYDLYMAICYSNKGYEKITKGKMIEEIIKQFQAENYLYNLCTKRELDCLKKIKNRQIRLNNIAKYEWEIRELNKKLILSGIIIFEEQEQNVKVALDYYQKNSDKVHDQLATFIIGFVKTNANMVVNAVDSMVRQLFNITTPDDAYFGHPLIHFYCGFYMKCLPSFNRDVEMIYYRDYDPFLEEIDDLRQEMGIAGNLEFDPQDYLDIFYYGFPINKPSVKKMYDEIIKLQKHDIIFGFIDMARVFNDNDILCYDLLDEKQIKLIEDALLDMPCAVMNGFTPKNYELEKVKEEEYNKKFLIVPQNNAKLCKRAADEFYKLYLALLDYVNNKYKINPKIKKIYKQEELNVNELIPIDAYLWKNKDKIIDEFVNINLNHFTEEELNKVKEFKKSRTDKYVIVGFDREYTMFLTEGIIYMVKGIRDDLDDILNPLNIPIIVNTTLLMFNGKIIYNSFFTMENIQMGNDFKLAVIKEMDKAIKYYHL